MNTLPLLFGALLVIAAASWLVAFVQVVKMRRHTVSEASHFYLYTHVGSFFTGSKFKPSAAPHLRRFRVAVAISIVMASFAIVIGFLAF